MAEAGLIRFVADPEGRVTPDLGRRLPGRGVWVAATRPALDEAVRRNLFSRSARARLSADPGLSDQVESLLARRCLEQLGLARREGALAPGFDKTQIAIKSGRCAWLVEARDGAADGRSKLLRLASRLRPGPSVCGCFSADELSLALGLENVIHVAFLAGRRADRWTEEVRRLAGFRPLLPESWREEARTGRDE